jgi:serine protease AprX
VAAEHPKLAQDLLRSLQDTSQSEQLPIIVRLSSERRIMRQGLAVRGARVERSYRLRPFVAMQATPEAIRSMEKDPGVVHIYRDQPVYALLNRSVPIIQVPRLWREEGLDGEGISIAIVDTGIDMEHPDFEGRIAGVADFTGEGPGDGHGHGTHCAGIAAGSGAASGGKYRGVAPKATLYSAKVLRSNGHGMMSDVMAGVEWAVEQGVRVISLSLGGPGPCNGTDALSELCDAAIEAGAVICVAAGNDGPGAYTVGSPGCARRVITIGASNNHDRIASFSSRGPTLDERIKPDVVLPGVDIVAARAQNTSMGTVVDDWYTSASGTSMATPHAAGVCALLLQADPTLSNDQIKARLMETAVNLGENAQAQGSGRVDAWRACHSQAEPEPTPEPEPGPEPTPDPGPSPTPPLPEPGQGCLTALLALLFAGRPRR